MYSFFKIKVYSFVYGSLYLFIMIILVGWLVTLIGHYVYYFLSNRKLNEDEEDSTSSNEMKDRVKVYNQLH